MRPRAWPSPARADPTWGGEEEEEGGGGYRRRAPEANSSFPWRAVPLRRAAPPLQEVRLRNSVTVSGLKLLQGSLLFISTDNSFLLGVIEGDWLLISVERFIVRLADG